MRTFPKSSSLLVGLFASLCPLWLNADASAALDPELTSHYQIHVVLKVAEHKMLTQEFQTKIEIELRDQLQLALGKLAKIDVSRAHPLLNELSTKGLQAVLEKWESFSNLKTHFVLIDYVDGQYEIQAGYHDGMTGIFSQVVRREAVGDRHRVADTAAQLVRQDFGVVGTFQKLSGKEVKLAIKGGALVDSLEPWVKRGDVFAVVRISEEAGKTRASPIEWALLQVIELQPGGYARCHYFCRYGEDHALADGGQVSGYRCAQLKTVRGPVRLRLVNDKTQEFLNLLVNVSANPEFRDAVQGTAVRGFFETDRPFENVAYVRILAAGKRVLAQFPVPLVDDRTVVCRLTPDPKLVKQGEIELVRERYVSSAVAAVGLADQRLNELNAEMPLEERPKLGRRLLLAIDADAARLSEERAKLLKLNSKLDLGVGDRLAAALAKKQEDLAKYINDVEQTIKDTNSDETRDLIARVHRASLLEKQADFDKAIELYMGVLEARDNIVVKANDAKWKAHLGQLKADWALKNQDHEAARKFVYTKWPTLDLPGVQANIAEAERSFQTCKESGDHLTPLKLQLVNIQHCTVLLKELQRRLKAPDSLDNRENLKAMQELARQLETLQTQVTAWVSKDKNAGK